MAFDCAKPGISRCYLIGPVIAPLSGHVLVHPQRPLVAPLLGTVHVRPPGSAVGSAERTAIALLSGTALVPPPAPACCTYTETSCRPTSKKDCQYSSAGISCRSSRDQPSLLPLFLRRDQPLYRQRDQPSILPLILRSDKTSLLPLFLRRKKPLYRQRPAVDPVLVTPQ